MSWGLGDRTAEGIPGTKAWPEGGAPQPPVSEEEEGARVTDTAQ